MSSFPGELTSLDAKLTTLFAAQLWGLNLQAAVCAEMWVIFTNMIPLKEGEEWDIVMDNVSEELAQAHQQSRSPWILLPFKSSSG